MCRTLPTLRTSRYLNEFMSGHSTKGVIHLIRRLLERYRNRKTVLNMVFIDLEKVYGKVSREVL